MEVSGSGLDMWTPGRSRGQVLTCDTCVTCQDLTPNLTCDTLCHMSRPDPESDPESDPILVTEK
jgi:hypothetical protein